MFHSHSPQAALFLLASLVSFPAGDVFVDQNAATCGTGDGTSANPVCTITEAIGLASPGDTIRIAPGFYIEYLTLGFDIELVGTGGQELTTISGITAPGNFGSVVTVSPGVTATLDGLMLRNGRSQGNGGGVRVAGDLVLRNSTVTENQVSAFGSGGGIGTTGTSANIVIENSTISSNYTPGGSGGGVFAGGDSLTIRNSTITDNGTYTPVWFGGGVYVFGLVYISNSTISNNTGFNFQGTTLPGSLISNTTIVGTNYVGFYTYGSIAIQNSIISSLSPSSAGAMYGNITSLGNNILGVAAYFGSTIVDGVNGDQYSLGINVLLGPLQDNGGPTETHALLPGSPAINAGHATSFEPLDQRGVVRPVQFTADIGAFEFGSTVNRNLCNGDAGNQMGCTNCPCLNDSLIGLIGGCLNRTGLPGRLDATGSHSVILPVGVTYDLRFSLSQLPPLSFSVLQSGDAVAPSNPANPCFGQESGVQSSSFDGLRCAIMNTRRHGGRAADMNGDIGVTNSPWGGEGGPPIGIARAFGGFASGQTRYFQAIYREDALAVCMRGLNTSQAVEVTFTP